MPCSFSDFGQDPALKYDVMVPSKDALLYRWVLCPSKRYLGKDELFGITYQELVHTT